MSAVTLPSCLATTWWNNIHNLHQAFLSQITNCTSVLVTMVVVYVTIDKMCTAWVWTIFFLINFFILIFLLVTSNGVFFFKIWVSQYMGALFKLAKPLNYFLIEYLCNDISVFTFEVRIWCVFWCIISQMLIFLAHSMKHFRVYWWFLFTGVCFLLRLILKIFC